MNKSIYLINSAIAWYKDSSGKIVLIDTSGKKKIGLTFEGSKIFERRLTREPVENNKIIRDFVEKNIAMKYCPEDPMFFSPGTIAAEITWRCNLKCKHCYVGRNVGTPLDWSISMFKNFIQEIKKLQVNGIALGGGEPFLHPLFKNF